MVVAPAYRRAAAVLVALAASVLVTATPQAADPLKITPTLDNITEVGSGCPIGSGGMIHEMRNGTPVFLYSDWGLNLNDSTPHDSNTYNGTVSKFCKQYLSLGNAPSGYQLHIAQVNIAGFATLEEGTFVGMRINTRFDGVEAGVSGFLPRSRLSVERIGKLSTRHRGRMRPSSPTS